MSQPTQGAVHVDAVLTNVSVAYVQNATNFIAAKVFPAVPVQKQTDKYFTYTKGDWFRDEAKLRPDSTESEGSGYGLSTATYSCDVFAFHKDVGEQVLKNADNPLNPMRDAAMFVTQRMMLRQEIQWVTDCFATSVWATDSTPTNLWSSYTTSDPISDVETGKTTILKNTGFEPNTLVLGYEVFVKLKHHPDIIDRMSGGATSGNMALAAEEHLSRIFGVDRVLVAKAVKNTGNEGESNSFAFTHGKHALLCYVNPSPGILAPSAGYTFQWTGVSDGFGTNIGITTIPMPALKADRVEGQISFDNKVVATDLGYFFNSAVA
ncbi:MAG: hypothetical protein AB7I42_23065 [Bradyrhizobium sp.]|uniref:hypothetical protein n=1 Tax=Bradyrhizobium sp. TaxID=376 RepID=UPI003D102716